MGGRRKDTLRVFLPQVGGNIPKNVFLSHWEYFSRYCVWLLVWIIQSCLFVQYFIFMVWTTVIEPFSLKRGWSSRDAYGWTGSTYRMFHKLCPEFLRFVFVKFKTLMLLLPHRSMQFKIFIYVKHFYLRRHFIKWLNVYTKIWTRACIKI